MGIVKLDKKQDTTICYLQEIHFKCYYSIMLKVIGFIKMYHANADKKKPRVCIIISDRVDTEQNTVRQTQ